MTRNSFWNGKVGKRTSELPSEHKGGVVFDYWTANPWFANAPRAAHDGDQDSDGPLPAASATYQTRLTKQHDYDEPSNSDYADDTATTCSDDYARSEPDTDDEYQRIESHSHNDD